MRLTQKYQQGKRINYFATSPTQQTEQPIEQPPENDSVLKYLNFISPSSLVGATIKKLAGNTKDFTDLVTEGSGVFTEEFHKEHPYISMATNMVLDSLIPGGIAKLGTKATVLKTLPKNIKNRVAFVGSAASGGSPTLGKQNAINYFFKNIDLHGNKVNRSDVLKYIFTGKGKENLGAIYTGGTRPVVSNYRDLSQAARYTEVPGKLPSIYQVNLGVVDESFDGQKLFQELRRANELNGGMLETPIAIEGGIIIGSKNMIKNPLVQNAVNSRRIKASGNKLTPVVVSDERNAKKALELLNSEEKPVYVMSINQRKIKGNRQAVTDLEGNAIHGKMKNGKLVQEGENAAKGDYTFNTGGINVYFYKKNGRLRKVEIDVYDHAGTGNSTKYGTDVSNLSFMKKYFSSGQRLKNMLSKAEDTSSLVIRYDSAMSSADFRHAMVNNFRIDPVSKKLVANKEGIEDLIEVVGNSKTGRNIGEGLYRSTKSETIIKYEKDFYKKQIDDMAKAQKLELDNTIKESLANQLMERVHAAGRAAEQKSVAYTKWANEKLRRNLYGLEQDEEFIKEYAEDIASLQRYDNSNRVFAFTEDHNDWYKILEENASTRNPRVERKVLTAVGPRNVNAQLRNKANNTILFINKYTKAAPEERIRMLGNLENTFFDIPYPNYPALDYNIQELYNMLHV